ncbi:MAG: carboxypeptidase regulatory-like domain-containing protein [Bacteroidia bacterium]|nr:carboxypeptidase regulatory-like domain-containing protein [Bacteroidia bacterium]
MKKILLKFSFTFLLAGFLLTNILGQLTTSGLKGSVLDEKNEALPGASIVAVHVPSGTQYGILTNEDGRFSLNNMRVGGPYQVTISFVGYNTQVYSDIVLSLGNVADMRIALTPSMTNLNEVIVSAGKNNIINSQRTGAAINMSNEVVASIPTISRGLKDFTKISPLANNAGSGTSFAGSNNRYNQFAIDGLVTNDVFGLAASGTNGGQTGIEPISLDAIEEFQINIAPYDVRQGGFTGGGINAVTKSGTNKFTGSAYFYGNNQKLVGKNEPIADTNKPVAEYKDYQAGFTIGGPIIKNKLFFFLNGEITRSLTPNGAMPGTSASSIDTSEIGRVIRVLNRVAPNYDPGSWQTINDETNSNKLFVKLNWNINNKNKLVLRHSYTFGENIDNSRSSTSLRFYNNGQYFPSTTNSTGLELSSILNGNMSNQLSLGYTRVRDDRDPLGASFPTVLINLTNGRSITLGSEYSSVANNLQQDIYSLTNDLTIFKGQHTITVGTHNELYSFYNLFVQNIFGSYAYKTLANFETIGTPGEVAPTYYTVSYSFDATDNPMQTKGAADWWAMQLGLYAQDEYQLLKNLQVTGGLRIDIPVFPVKPESNPQFNTTYYFQDVATGTLPKSRIMWSPRIGFNWDALGNKTLQVRGGTGLFTGRVPFVWISNQFSNNGQLNGTLTLGNSSSSSSPLPNPPGPLFVADPYAQKLASDLGKTPGRGAINVVDPNLKFPQVFRTNLAADYKLPWDIVATVEGIFSKTYNNVNFINLNKKIDPAFTFVGNDTRPRFVSGLVNSSFDQIIKFENTNEGYSYNIVVMLQKQFEKGFNAQASYTYGTSWDLNSGTSSVAYSNWRYVNNVNGLNDLSLTRSNFDLGHRVTGLVSYKIEYVKKMLSTTVSLFYNGQSGQPISYIYNGDMNNDGTTNDMIYIPAQMSDINLIIIPAAGSSPAITPDEQWTALDAFISGDKYLSKHRGEYAERNAGRLPFSHQFDLKILQDVKVDIGGTGNKLQLSLDIINIGNLINKKWGESLYLSNQQYSLINYKGQVTTTTPTFTYAPSGMTNGNAYSVSDFSSRWRMQIGLRYLFN